MKWQGGRRSRNIEDRRRSGGRTRAGGVGGIGAIVLLLAGWYFGVDVSGFVGQGAGGNSTQGEEMTQADVQAGEFVAVNLGYTEDIWKEIFRTQVGQEYNPPTMVLFKGSTQSACGGASAATGPFYCPPERRAFLDTSFFTTLDRQMAAKGDFAAAYVCRA